MLNNSAKSGLLPDPNASNPVVGMKTLFGKYRWRILFASILIIIIILAIVFIPKLKQTTATAIATTATTQPTTNFPPDSAGASTWGLAPYNFTATSSTTVNGSHMPGTSFAYLTVDKYSGWICSNGKYSTITGLPTGTAASTLVGGVPVAGEYLQLQTSVGVSITGFYYGGLADTSNSTATDFKLVGSNDGTNFTLLSSQTGQTILYPGKQYTLSATTAVYKYFRFIITLIPASAIARAAIGSGTVFNL